MFITLDDTTLSETLNVTNHKSNQPIRSIELNISAEGYQRFVLSREWY